jgi:hypothetical protein
LSARQEEKNEIRASLAERQTINWIEKAPPSIFEEVPF